MDMKKLIESMDHIEECGMTEMPAAMPAPEMDKGNPVTMSVSLNASGKEHVDDLINMMKNAGMSAAEPVGAKMLSPRMDMERLSSIMGEPKDEPEMEEIEEGADPKLASMIAKFVDDVEAELRYFGQPDAAKVGMLIKQGNVEDAAGEMADAMTDQDGGSDKFDMVMQTAQEYIEAYMSEDEIEVEGDYANEPDPQYGDMSDAIPDGNDLNRKKKAYPATQDGDNPMAVEAIKATLMKALAEKKKPDSNKNGIPDYAEDGKGKNDLAKGSKPKKGQVPPQFKKK
jgi:hypothetical protein